MEARIIVEKEWPHGLGEAVKVKQLSSSNICIFWLEFYVLCTPKYDGLRGWFALIFTSYEGYFEHVTIARYSLSTIMG